MRKIISGLDNLKMNNRSVSILFTNIGPYHIARVLAMKNLFKGQVIPIQLSSNEKLRKWKIDDNIGILSVQESPLEDANMQELSNKVVKVLKQIQPDAIAVAGYSLPPMRSAAIWAKKNKVAAILMSDSHEVDKQRNWLKETIKGWWIRRYFLSAFVGGWRAAEYLIKHGFPPDRIWRGYNVVDNEYFGSRTEQIRRNEQVWRENLGLPEKYFLYVGRFSPEKNLIRLLRAYRIYCNKMQKQSWRLVLVGSGPQEKELRKISESLELHNVFFPGFKQIEELPYYYTLGSCFVLPSISESWGLAINEAMASGLPVLVSWKCGCAPELVHPGVNGYLFNPENEEEIAYFMHRISSGELDLIKMGEASKRIIKNFSPETWALSLKDCIEVTMKSKMPP